MDKATMVLCTFISAVLIAGCLGGQGGQPTGTPVITATPTAPAATARPTLGDDDLNPPAPPSDGNAISDVGNPPSPATQAGPVAISDSDLNAGSNPDDTSAVSDAPTVPAG
jgi:hypothetical protein